MSLLPLRRALTPTLAPSRALHNTSLLRSTVGYGGNEPSDSPPPPHKSSVAGDPPKGEKSKKKAEGPGEKKEGRENPPERRSNGDERERGDVPGGSAKGYQ